MEWQPSEGGGPPKFAEVPGSARVIEADLCLLAMGFLGPEATLAEALGEQGRGGWPAARRAGRWWLVAADASPCRPKQIT